VNRSELESKHLAELHTLAAEADIPRYRMLSKAELIERLADGGAAEGAASGRSRRGGQRRRRPREERPRERRERKPAERPEPAEPAPQAEAPPATAPPRGRRRRRRRFGRRRREVSLVQLLLPAAPGRQAVVYADTREACTALLRGAAAELAKASRGPDPIAVLVDPSPEELAEWRRDAPQAEIVAAGQARHVEDAVAQAASRSQAGEDVIVLIDSLSRFAESYADADAAQEIFDAGRQAASAGGGSLTIVAALEPSG
jgi:transcription termination factor Rho